MKVRRIDDLLGRVAYVNDRPFLIEGLVVPAYNRTLDNIFVVSYGPNVRRAPLRSVRRLQSPRFYCERFRSFLKLENCEICFCEGTYKCPYETGRPF